MSQSYIAPRGISPQAVQLVEKFKRDHAHRLADLLSNPTFKSYTSIDDLLIRKYGITDLESRKPSDFRKKTEFLDCNGNLVEGILTYGQADRIIESALQLDI